MLSSSEFADVLNGPSPVISASLKAPARPVFITLRKDHWFEHT